MQGSIVARLKSDGHRKYFAVYRAGGKQKWKGFDKKGDAERFLTNQVKSVQDGSYQAIRPRLMKDVFDSWITDSLETRLHLGNLKPSTAKSYRSMLATHLRPAFENFRSDKLTHGAVTEWIAKLAARLGETDKRLRPQTFNNVLNLFHSILAWSKHPAQSFIAHDPLAGQKRAKKQQVERDFLQPEEIEHLLKSAEPPTDTILHLVVYTGMRRGELFALKWEDVNWGNGTTGGEIRVRRSIYQGAITSPKTKNSIRKIDVTQRTLDELSMYKLGFPALEGGFIFRQATGHPIDPDNWQKDVFLPLLEKAEMRRIGLHSLRHTYASLLINSGESIKYVSKQLGHSSIAITADTYGHLFKETSIAAMKRLQQQIPEREQVVAS